MSVGSSFPGPKLNLTLPCLDVVLVPFPENWGLSRSLAPSQSPQEGTNSPAQASGQVG